MNKGKFNLAIAVFLSGLNMFFAIEVYLSLHGWLWVAHESSGMQLMFHTVITAPIALITTVWLFYISKPGIFSSKFWKVNLVGMLVPFMSFFAGGVPYYDIAGIVVSVLVITCLLALTVAHDYRRKIPT